MRASWWWWVLAWTAVREGGGGENFAEGMDGLPVQLLGVEQHPVMIEPRAHSALFMNFGHPHAIDALFGMPGWPPWPGSAQTELSARPGASEGEGPEDASAQASPVEPFFQPQDALNGGASSPGKRCHRCHMRRAVRGHFDAHKQWTTLLCRVCVDALGTDARRTTLLLNSRCSECTRVAAFGPAHGNKRLVLPPAEPQFPNRTLTLRSVPVHCKEHRKDGEVDVKHPRCNWPGPPVVEGTYPQKSALQKPYPLRSDKGDRDSIVRHRILRNQQRLNVQRI